MTTPLRLRARCDDAGAPRDAAENATVSISGSVRDTHRLAVATTLPRAAAVWPRETTIFLSLSLNADVRKVESANHPANLYTWMDGRPRDQTADVQNSRGLLGSAPRTRRLRSLPSSRRSRPGHAALDVPRRARDRRVGRHVAAWCVMSAPLLSRSLRGRGQLVHKNTNVEYIFIYKTRCNRRTRWRYTMKGSETVAGTVLLRARYAGICSASMPTSARRAATTTSLTSSSSFERQHTRGFFRISSRCQRETSSEERRALKSRLLTNATSEIDAIFRAGAAAICPQAQRSRDRNDDILEKFAIAQPRYLCRTAEDSAKII